MREFLHYIQPDLKDCGPTCLKIILNFYSMKRLESLKGVIPLSREQQKTILGGCAAHLECDENWGNSGGGASTTCSVYECNDITYCYAGTGTCDSCIERPGGGYNYCT